jgi:hypothetical protein
MLRWIIVVLLILVGASFYFARQRSDQRFEAARGAQVDAALASPQNASGATLGRPQILASGCAPPASIVAGDGTLQTDTPGSMSPFQHQDAMLKPLAGFSVDARVLSAKTYRSDREARYAPIDLALGWGPMRDDAVLSSLSITQSGRWYEYRWSAQPPIAIDEIARSSANMHMIPSSTAVANALSRLGKDDRIRIDGWLVEVEASDGWRWRSSLSRDDRGQGACEVIYVCTVAKRHQP